MVDSTRVRLSEYFSLLPKFNSNAGRVFSTNRTKVLSALSGLLMLAGLPAQAESLIARCNEAPALTITRIDEPAKLVRRMPRGVEVDKAFMFRVWGFTKMIYAPDIELEWQRLSQGDKSCLRVKEARVTMGIEQPLVWIKSKLHKGSCEYDVTLQHESQHVVYYNTYIADATALLEKDLARTLRGETYSMRQPDVTDKMQLAALEADIQNILLDMLKPLEAATIKKNRLIDNPATYAKEARVCPRFAKEEAAIVAELQAAAEAALAREAAKAEVHTH